MMNRPVICATITLCPFLIGAMTACNNANAQEVPFRKVTLTKEFYGEGIHHVDMNDDGKVDVISGPFIYYGPDFEIKKTYYEPEAIDPHKYSENYLIATYDFNRDGHLDIFKYGRAGMEANWYANPGTPDGEWKKYFALEAPGNEARYFTDLDNDGRPEGVFISNGKLALGRPDWKNVEQPWRIQPISRDMGWERFTHGMGVGDVNGDGRPDVIAKSGWWEQPSRNADKGEWIEHPFTFSEAGGAQMLVHDVNADGKNDIITSLDAHGYGIAWFEQKGAGKEVTFEKHMILGDRKEFEEGKYPAVFSQPHTLALGDFNGDGLLDFASGKRYWAHGPNGDPEPGADPVVYWFELIRDGNTIRFVPHLIDNQSGAGCTMETGDLNNDGTTDILVANKFGAYLFLNESKKQKHKTN